MGSADRIRRSTMYVQYRHTGGRDILQDGVKGISQIVPRGYRSLVSCETFLTARLKQKTYDWPVRTYERSRFFNEKAAPLALSHP